MIAKMFCRNAFWHRQLTIGSKWADSDNVKKLVATYQDPAVQQYLATDPAVKNILLPLKQ